MDNSKVISVNSSPPVTISSTSDNTVMVRYMYKSDNTNCVKMEPENLKLLSYSERVPVSWCSEKHKVYSVFTKPPNHSNTTPSPKTKVVNWLTKKSDWNQVSEGQKSAIIARHDFKKSYSVSRAVKMFSASTETTSTEKLEVFEKHNVFNITTNNSDLPRKHGRFEIENSIPSVSNTHLVKDKQSNKNGNIFVKNLANRENTDKNFSQTKQENISAVRSHQKNVHIDTPLSPESMKKKELCTYLQLVNLKVANNKKAAPIQNRRSIRVKNNLLLAKKKEFERKLNYEDSTAELGNGSIVQEEDGSKKSFKDLFGENDILTIKNDENLIKGCERIGYIPKELLEKREDFDQCAQEFFRKENVQIPQKKKPRKLNFKNGFIAKWVTRKQNKALKKGKMKHVGKVFKKPAKRNGVSIAGKKKSKEVKVCRNVKRRKTESGVTNSVKNKKDVNRVNNQKNKRKLIRKKFLLRRRKVTEKKEKEDEEVKIEVNGVSADIVMQDHCYIIYNDENTEQNMDDSDCSNKSTSSVSQCHGFSSPGNSHKSYLEINKLCNKLNEGMENRQKSPTKTVDLNADANLTSDNLSDTKSKADIIDPNRLSPKSCEYVALDPEIKPKSLHRTLITQRIRKKRFYNTDCEADESTNWDTVDSPSTSKQKRNTLSHSIDTTKEAGAVVNAFYKNFTLVIAQEYAVSFWCQSALGNILEAHNMWLPKGQVSRLVLDSGCIQKDSNEMVISLESSIAYVELWTKEHKSDKREIPVSDVFAAIYFCRLRQNGVFKKVLQLENIKSSAEDVRYIVIEYSRSVIVSWRIVRNNEKVTVIHCYRLAADYQTVEVIKEFGSVRHYVSSLHNVEGSDDLIVGWGENMVTLWNLEYGYVIATIGISETMPLSSPLHVKCDRGFLFLLQQLENKNLCLIAINGLNQSWKRLQTFVPPENFENITGVYMENGLLVVFYKNGVLAWHINSGELRVEEEGLNCDLAIPSGKHAIIFSNGRVYVRHALALLIVNDDCMGIFDGQ